MAHQDPSPVAKLVGAWWWIDRWRQSSAYTDFSPEQRGMYRDLLDEVWLRGDHVIPDDDRILGRIVGDYDRWMANRSIVLSKFRRVSGGWTHDTALEVISKALSLKEKRSISGKEGAKSRWQTDSKQHGKPIANGIAKGIAKTCHPSPSPSPSPFTVSDTITNTETEHDSVENGDTRLMSGNGSQSSVELTLHGGGIHSEAQAAREVFDYWRVKTNHLRAQWTDDRRRALVIRLREEPGTLNQKVEGIKLVVDGALAHPLYNGSEKGRPYLEFENLFVHKGRNRIETLQRAAQGLSSVKPKTLADRSREVISAYKRPGEEP